MVGLRQVQIQSGCSDTVLPLFLDCSARWELPRNFFKCLKQVDLAGGSDLLGKHHKHRISLWHDFQQMAPLSPQKVQCPSSGLLLHHHSQSKIENPFDFASTPLFGLETAYLVVDDKGPPFS